ncbi:MAG: FHA domain-containing protein [Planctomycetota bacterium]|jgi:hypothetical protein
MQVFVGDLLVHCCRRGMVAPCWLSIITWSVLLVVRTVCAPGVVTSWAVSSLGSRNGTLLNGQRLVGEQILADGDRIQLGGQVYEYHMVPAGSDLGVLADQAPSISDDATMDAGVTAHEVYTKGADFSGALGGDGLLEMLQFLSQTAKSGRMYLLRAGRHIGSLCVVAGAVREARMGRDEGLEALVALASCGVDHFAFHGGDETPTGAVIAGSASAILFELARRCDEGAA